MIDIVRHVCATLYLKLYIIIQMSSHSLPEMLKIMYNLVLLFLGCSNVFAQNGDRKQNIFKFPSNRTMLTCFYQINWNTAHIVVYQKLFVCTQNRWKNSSVHHPSSVFKVCLHRFFHGVLVLHKFYRYNQYQLISHKH